MEYTTVASSETEDAREKRRFFAVHQDVADSFMRIAARKNLTMYGAVTDVLREAVQLDVQGSSITDASEALREFRIAKEAGLVMVPETLWCDLVESMLKTDKNGTLTRFRDAGRWLGRYILAKSHGLDLSVHLRETLAPLTFDCSEFIIEEKGNIHVRCFNPSHSQSYAEAFSTLLSATVESLGYNCVGSAFSRGAVMLNFEKRQEPVIRAREK